MRAAQRSFRQRDGEIAAKDACVTGVAHVHFSFQWRYGDQDESQVGGLPHTPIQTFFEFLTTQITMLSLSLRNILLATLLLGTYGEARACVLAPGSDDFVLAHLSAISFHSCPSDDPRAR